jgi:carbon-monoxide dehydrogenase medium subunit
MWHNYFNVSSLDEALDLLFQHGAGARIVAGATDLILEIERGVRSGIHSLIDITRIPELEQITLDEDGFIHLGPLVTHNACVSSKIITERALPLAQAAWEVGAPQIRNRGTIAGNLITASPANDTITPLIALGAQVTLASKSEKRTILLSEFYTGVRKTVMQPDEILVDIVFPALQANQRAMFLKLGLRRAQAISVVNAAAVVTFSEGNVRKATEAVITLGAVAPTIIHATQAESYLQDRQLAPAVIAHAAELASRAATPIDDLRAPANYRSEMVRVAVQRLLENISNGQERANFPNHPILLSTRLAHKTQSFESASHTPDSVIHTQINGKFYDLPGGQGKTLLQLLRDDAGLTGTKEGCAEGECGACTVFLDGMAVMSCLTPAERAQGAEIITIEGLAKNGQLHPVQQAFIDAGAVQCGYCTPGFLMSAVKLLEEKIQPDRSEIEQAITGNLCRCTGYYKIVEAIEAASYSMFKSEV